MSKPKIDNTETAKAKKQKEKLEVSVKDAKDFKFGKTTYTAEDLVAHADAVAGAKKAIGAIKKTTEESEKILKGYMYRNWCEEFALNGHAPDMREMIGKLGRMDVSQYTSAEVPAAKAESLKEMNLDIASYSRQTKYKIRMGNVPKPMVGAMLDAIRDTLGDDMYDNVVSNFFTLEADFFTNFREIVQGSLAKNENLSVKMEEAINLVKPTIQFLKPSSEMTETEGYDLAFEFSEIGKRKK